MHMERREGGTRRAGLLAASAAFLLFAFLFFALRFRPCHEVAQPAGASSCDTPIAPNGKDPGVGVEREPGTRREPTESGNSSHQDTTIDDSAAVVRVDGRLTYAGADHALAGVGVLLASRSRSLWEVLTDEHGAFSLDATRLDSGDIGTLSLVISDSQTELSRFDIPRTAFRLDDKSRTWVAFVELELTNVLVVSGRMVTVIGAPVADCEVAVETPGSVLRAATVLGRARTGQGGRFELHAKSAPGPQRLLGTKSGFRPAVRPFDVPAAGLVELGDIAIDQGVSIVGRLDSRFPPASRATLVRAQSDVQGHLFVDPMLGELVWHDEKLDNFAVTVSVDESGCFTVSGLDAGKYLVEARRVGMASRATREPNQLTVVAPAEGVILHEGGALVRILVFDANSGVQVLAANGGPRLVFDGESVPPMGWPLCDGDVPRPILFDPMVANQGLVVASGYYPRRVNFTSPEDGGVLDLTVKVNPVRMERDVTLHTVRSDGSIVADVDVAVSIDVNGAWEEVASMSSSSPTGEHVIARVPGPRARLHVAAGGPNGRFGMDYALPLNVEVDVARQTDLHVTLRIGGFLAVRATDDTGTPIPARCQLMNGGAGFGVLDFVCDGPPIMTYSGWLGPAGEARSLHPVEAGPQVLRVEYDGFAAKEIPVTTVAGASCNVSVLLNRIVRDK